MELTKRILGNKKIIVSVCIILLGCWIAICHYRVSRNNSTMQEKQKDDITMTSKTNEKDLSAVHKDEKTDIQLVNVSAIEDQYYTGKPIEPKVTLNYNNKTLEKDNDYTLSFFNNIKVGIGEIKITGKGDYEGSVSVSFNIVEQKIVNHKQEDKKKEDKKQISIQKAKLSPIENQIYTGKAIMPHIELYYNNKVLEKDTDYTVSYLDNTDVGTAKIIIKGIGHYVGELTVSFEIIEKKNQEIKTIELNTLTTHHGFKGYYTKDDNILNVDKNKLGLGENDSISLYFIEYYDVNTGESILFACPYVQEVVFMEYVDKAGGWDSVPVKVKQ